MVGDYDYEVFLSFRGVDTRQGFTDILYQYLTMAEIRVFRDDDELEIGDKIDSILGGLASSKICIPIFSPNFAESKWCLREVAEMVHLEKTIVPVFYKVSPDDVKLKQGSVYWDGLRKLEKKQGSNHKEEIGNWKNALKEAASIKGRELGFKSYSQFCKELVDEVLSKLGPRKRLEEIDHFTGEANKARTMELLDMRSNKEVVYVGIHGMGGIGESSWFALGSRIVLTTRDKKVLEDCAVESGTEIRYLEMAELDSVWALELFSRCAFGKDSPPSPYQNLSERAVASAGGLPLAITVIAKYLRNKKEAVWEEIIKRLKKTPPKEVKDKLMISYNALEEEQKSIFLDIACLFIYHEYTETSNTFYMWEACGLCPRWSLEVLQSMSLVKVDKDILMMHDQLRDLGRDIVRIQSERDLTKQSRLWEWDDIAEVLKCKKKHKNNIEAIQLDWWKWEGEYVDFVDEDITSFDNLRYFRWACLKGNFSGLLLQLKWLQCSRSIIWTTNLAPSNLVILGLSGSDVNENWNGWSQIQL